MAKSGSNNPTAGTTGQFDSSLDELYSWIDTIPLSRPKRNISRDFADGVLVAEVVANFLPKLVELHNYCSASSGAQKRTNWQTLNRRVFAKMGMRISDEVIVQLSEAKPGVIEKVLWDIRAKIDQLTSSAPEGQPAAKATTRRLEAGTRSFPLTSQQPDESQLTYRVTSPRVCIPSNSLHSASAERSGSYNDLKSPAARTGVPLLELPTDRPGSAEPNRRSSVGMSHLTQGFAVLTATAGHMSQGYVAPPALENNNNSPPGVPGAAGTLRLSPVLDKNDNNVISTGGPPAQIIYRGHKMIPLQFLDDREKEIKALESSNRALTLKIHRLETLVGLKDQRIEDLTHQLQNLRSMYERVTDSSIAVRA